MTNSPTLSGLYDADFNRVIDSKVTMLCVLTNESGAEMCVTNYGAKIVSLMVPSKNGTPTDVVTGHASIDDYLTSEEPYFGAICGRYCNRIAKGRFTLDGILYDQLALNNGPNNLHGGPKGFHAVVWDMHILSNRTVVFYYRSADGEEGFPGTLKAEVTYHLSNENSVHIHYIASTNKPTVLNLTNHSYFNLSGAGDPYIGDHLLTINAEYYLPTDETCIPYGPKEKVEGTPMDFRTPQAIGDRINDNFEQLLFGNGYDHTYILNDAHNKTVSLIKDTEVPTSFCARCISPKTGIAMEVFTSEPGVQLYTGNWMTGNLIGKNGLRYPKRSALCLETQHFPDSPNKPEYPSTTLLPKITFESTTIYKFFII